jgi:hypothetical protein
LRLGRGTVRPPLPKAPGAEREPPDELFDLAEGKLYLITCTISGKVIAQRIVLSQSAPNRQSVLYLNEIRSHRPAQDNPISFNTAFTAMRSGYRTTRGFGLGR